MKGTTLSDNILDSGEIQRLNAVMNKDRENRNTTFLYFLTDWYDTYQKFSNNGAKVTKPDGTVEPHSGLEQLHGGYHITIGGYSQARTLGGHMSRVPVAAFDPVFWLHHWYEHSNSVECYKAWRC